VALREIRNKAVNPQPKKNPVTNRRGLVLSYRVISWANPSMTIGTMIAADVETDGSQKKLTTAHSRMPTSSPVHRAQMGKHFPRQ